MRRAKRVLGGSWTWPGSARIPAVPAAATYTVARKQQTPEPLIIGSARTRRTWQSTVGGNNAIEGRPPAVSPKTGRIAGWAADLLRKARGACPCPNITQAPPTRVAPPAGDGVGPAAVVAFTLFLGRPRIRTPPPRPRQRSRPPSSRIRAFRKCATTAGESGAAASSPANTRLPTRRPSVLVATAFFVGTNVFKKRGQAGTHAEALAAAAICPTEVPRLQPCGRRQAPFRECGSFCPDAAAPAAFAPSAPSHVESPFRPGAERSCDKYRGDARQARVWTPARHLPIAADTAAKHRTRTNKKPVTGARSVGSVRHHGHAQWQQVMESRRRR